MSTSIKLTNERRDIILRRAIDGIFRKREESLQAESNALAILAYDRVYPTDIQTQMAKLPAEFFFQQSSVYVKTSPDVQKVELMLTSSRRIAAVHKGWRALVWEIGPDEDNTVIRRIGAFVAKRDKLSKDKDFFRSKLRAMLYSISTMKRLQDEWPEGAEYYKESAPTQPTANVPAVRAEDINKLIEEMTK